jgi:hypothetical protein
MLVGNSDSTHYMNDSRFYMNDSVHYMNDPMHYMNDPTHQYLNRGMGYNMHEGFMQMPEQGPTTGRMKQLLPAAGGMYMAPSMAMRSGCGPGMLSPCATSFAPNLMDDSALQSTECSSTASVTVEEDDAVLQRQWQRSRRQRRKRRGSLASSAVAAVLTDGWATALKDVPQLDDFVSDDFERPRSRSPSVEREYWPATPEYTPRGSLTPEVVSVNCVKGKKVESEDVSDCIIKTLSSGCPEKKVLLLERIVPSAWSMACTPGGSRIVQTAFDVGSAKDRADMVLQFVGHVAEAAKCPHANFVLQKCIAMMPTDRLQFVIQELQGRAVATAQHRFGCRVMERIIEHFPRDQTAQLVEEILSGGPKLIRHTFANFVVQHILEHGSKKQRQQIVELLKSDAMLFAKHWVANHVMKCAVVHCDPEDREQLMQELSKDEEEFSNLSRHRWGCIVVKEMCRFMPRGSVRRRKHIVPSSTPSSTAAATSTAVVGSSSVSS